MKNVKPYLKQRYLLLTSFGAGMAALVYVACGLLLFTAMDRFADTSIGMIAFSSILLNLLCIAYFVCLIGQVLLCAGYALRLFTLKDTGVPMWILGGGACVSLLCSLFLLPFFLPLYRIIGGDFTAIAYFVMTNLQNTHIFLFLFPIAPILCGGFAGYLHFIKKSDAGADVEETMDTAHGIDTRQLKEKLNQAGNAAGESAAKLSQKWKAYYATKKGKRIVRLVGAGAAVVVVAAGSFGIYLSVRKTPVDLTAGCTVDFTGVSGEGSALISCFPDYDLNDEKITLFVQTVSWEVDNNGALSNGDKVKLRAVYSEETAKGSKVEVVNPEKELTVEGLEEVYRTFADIPEDISSQFAAAAKNVLDADIMSAEGGWGPDQITINSLDLIGTYYRYQSYSHNGQAYYVFRANVSETHEYNTYTRTNTNTDYYYVEINPINTVEMPDLSLTSDDIQVHSIYLYSDEKTDADAIRRFKNSNSEIQTVSENTSDKTYQDKSVEKDK